MIATTRDRPGRATHPEPAMTALPDRTARGRPVIVRTGAPQIGADVAVGGWLLAWIIGQTATLLIVAAATTTGQDPAVPLVAAGSAATWTAYLFVMARASQRYGTGRFRTDFGLSFDPYPYIFLNLMLSTLAAVQAPVIMMSQNRQATKDRLAASLDYETNLRAEIDILRLHHKLDTHVIERLAALEAKIDALTSKSG